MAAGVLVACVVLAVSLAPWARLTPAAALVVAWPLALALAGGYAPRALAAPGEEARRIVLAALGLLAAAGAASYVHNELIFRGVLLPALPALPLAGLAGRAAARSLLARQQAAGRLVPRVLVAGCDSDVRAVVSHFEARRPGVGRVVGVVLPPGEPGQRRELLLDDVPRLTGLEDIGRAVDLVDADTVVVAGGQLSGLALRKLAWSLEGRDVELAVAPGVVATDGHRLSIRVTDGLPLLQVAQPRFTGSTRVVKEIFDRTVAGIALVGLLPLLLALGLAVRMSSPGTAIFRQVRVGRNGQPFTMYKFRTMTDDAEVRRTELLASNEAGGPLFKLREDPRVTSVGRVLRKYSLDELPQLANVVLGHMSIVGPRPPLPSEVATYADEVHRRLLVKPGLTGLWQVSGRSDLTWDESVDLDLRYVDNWCLGQDAAILRRTVRAVLRGRGAY